jgi:DNA replication protein DnaC
MGGNMMQDVKSAATGMLANQSVALELYCDKCGGKRYTEVDILGAVRRMKVMCPCEKAEFEASERDGMNREKQLRLESLIKNSLMDDSFRERTFAEWDFLKGSRKMYNVGIRYAEKFRELKKTGIGLLIYGEPGNGKTHLCCCIANALLREYVPAICVSINGLLGRIKETYNKGGKEAEADILRWLAMADLLIIDDLGTEPATEWSVSMIYNIIDSRYRSKLPLIITSNLSIDPSKTNGVLADIYGRRTEDRILEMCTPILNSGKSIRLQEAKRKTEVLKSILGGDGNDRA